MSSSDRRLLLTLGLAALLVAPACTLTPAYAPGAPARALLGQVMVDAPSDRNGFALVQRLEERLGRGQGSALSYTIRTKAEGVGITEESAITRYTLSGEVEWTLSGPDGTRLAGGTERDFTSYTATGSTVAGLAAEEDAAQRLMRILADRIVTRLIAVSARLP